MPRIKHIRQCPLDVRRHHEITYEGKFPHAEKIPMDDHRMDQALESVRRVARENGITFDRHQVYVSLITCGYKVKGYGIFKLSSYSGATHYRPEGVADGESIIVLMAEVEFHDDIPRHEKDGVILHELCHALGLELNGDSDEGAIQHLLDKYGAPKNLSELPNINRFAEKRKNELEKPANQQEKYVEKLKEADREVLGYVRPKTAAYARNTT